MRIQNQCRRWKECNMMNFIFGRFSWDALPHEWFTIGGTIAITTLGIGVAIFLTRTKRWKWLWKDWLTSTDPKRIGIMYLIVSAFMLFRGGLDAVMIWTQQSLSAGSSYGYLDAQHFQVILTAHGDI